MINKYFIISMSSMWLSIIATIISASLDNFPMTIMWGIISLFELVIFCIIILSDIVIVEGEKPTVKCGYKEFVEETGQLLRFATWKRHKKLKESENN